MTCVHMTIHCGNLHYTEKDITNGTVTISVNCGVLHCYTNTFGLCDDVERKCPIKAGQGSLLLDNPIPNYKYVRITKKLLTVCITVCLC